MIILIHVIIAISSITLASGAFFKPSIQKLAASYGLMIATVATGSYLLVTTPGDILQSCIMGLAYLAIAISATIATHVRLARAEVRI
jgi:hypothetical protein